MRSLDTDGIDSRITFDPKDEIMEVSFEGLRFEHSADVNRFYDRIEERIASSGEGLWRFLVNYKETWIEPDAWFAFARRGKELNLAHSMGSARYDASEITLRQIEQAGGNENFDPGLFYDREGAVARLRSLPSRRRNQARHNEVPLSFKIRDLNWRLEFDPQSQIAFVDFAGMSFEHARDVNFVYDFLEQQFSATGRKWYFLINYNGTRIQDAAWVQYAARGKALNVAWSLGSVRYALGSETEQDIRLRAESQGFRPNIRNTRAEAVQRIEEMKADAAAR